MDWTFWIYIWIIAIIRDQICVFGTSVWEDRVRFLREPNEKLIVNAGSNLELPCLAVNGTSNNSGRRLSVRWLRNGILVDDLIPQANGSLILRNVQIQNEAVYQCAVLSPRYGVVLSQRANLTIFKITNFTTEPQDLTVPVGDTVRFQCLVASNTIPSPKYVWFHKELPLLNDDNRIRILASGILQIVNVRKTDDGPYYCVASNIAGNITSRTAILTTSQDSAQFLEKHTSIRVLKAPTNVSVTIGQTAIFECLLDGADTVRWKRADESPISSKGYQIGTNLVIANVTPWEDGMYVCIGSKAGAKPATLQAYLSVDSAPEIKKFPEETLRHRGKWWRFHCDTASKPAPEITWFKDGEKLKSHGRVKIFPNEEEPPGRLDKPSGEITYRRDLLIASVKSEDVGMYQCFASNYLGTVSAAAALTYLDLGLEGPDNLTAKILPNQKEMELTWHAPSSENEQYKLTVYIVHFHESESGSENTIAVQQDACHDGICRAVCCSPNVDLVPHTNYTFWVDALVDYQGEPVFTGTTENVVAISGDATPLTGASIMVQELKDPTKVRLVWQPPEHKDLRGELVEYRIELKERLTENGIDEMKPTVIIPPALNNFIIDGLGPGMYVYFRIIPSTRAGYPDTLPTKSFPWIRHKMRTATATLDAPAAPTIDALALNETSVLVQWTDIYRDGVSKWLISGNRSGDGLRVVRSEVDGRSKSVILLGLASDTLYQISVVGVTANGLEGLSTSRLIKTSNAAAPPAVAMPPQTDPIIPFPTPRCQSAGSAKLNVSWNTPPHMKIVKFAIRYSLAPDNNEPLNVSAFVKTVETSGNFLLFSDLMPGQTYLFAARAENADGYKSGFSDDILCFVPVTRPPPPSHVDVTIINGTNLLVAWSVPAISDDIGEILYYHVRYSNKLAESTGWKEISVNSSNHSVYLTDLEPSAVYFVSISAENEAGRGLESPTKAIHTGADPNADDMGIPKVIFRTSYKEGIIIGVCIAVICAAVCAAVFFIRARRERYFCFHCFASRGRTTAHKSSNGHVQNGNCNSERRIELAEIQTLLPRLIENSESDSKGGIGFYGPRGCPISRANFSSPPPASNGVANNDDNAIQEISQPHNELLTVSIQSPCTDADPQHREQSSDLSHSPATASSLGSWIHGHNGELANAYLLQKLHHSSISMPNLFDSGIGFDDLSTSTQYGHGKFQLYPVPNGSAKRDCAHFVNISSTAAADSVTLPDCGYAENGAVNVRNAPENGKMKRLRDYLIPQRQLDASNGRAATALGPAGLTLSHGRATSQCTC